MRKFSSQASAQLRQWCDQSVLAGTHILIDLVWGMTLVYVARPSSTPPHVIPWSRHRPERLPSISTTTPSKSEGTQFFALEHLRRTNNAYKQTFQTKTFIWFLDVISLSNSIGWNPDVASNLESASAFRSFSNTFSQTAILSLSSFTCLVPLYNFRHRRALVRRSYATHSTISIFCSHFNCVLSLGNSGNHGRI